MSDDAHLLSAFVRDRSEAAFRELVRRHLALVLATARRVLGGDPHLAQDVAQVVFTDFARKAPGLPADTVPAGWLWRHTRFVAANTVRAESRRRQREHTAMHLHALNDAPGHDARWQRLAPVLDDALATLDAPDRDALVLRYLGDASLRDVGRALGTGEDAAQKRTARALEKLRATLLSRGVTFTGALLTATLEVGAAAPPVSSSLVASVSRAALAPAAGAALLAMLKTKTFLATAAALAVAVTFVLSSTPTAPADVPPPPVAATPSSAADQAAGAPSPSALPSTAADAALANALAQLATSQTTGPSPSAGPIIFTSTGAAARARSASLQTMASDTLSYSIRFLSDMANQTIVLPAELAQQPSRVTFLMLGYPMPPVEIASQLRVAYERAGWAFDPQPNGSLQMRLANTTNSRPDVVFDVIINYAEKPVNSPISSVSTGGGSVGVAVEFLISWITGRQTGVAGSSADEKKLWGPSVADNLDISPGVWQNHGEMGKVVIKADSIADARRQMMDALRRQAGISVEILPDRTLKMRLENGDDDPVLPARNFNATPIPEVIEFLTSISGRSYQFPYILPRLIRGGGGGGRGGGGGGARNPQVTVSPVASIPGIQELAGRSFSLHMEGGPTSQVIAQVLAALETQAEIIAEESSAHPRNVNLRLTAPGVFKMRYSVQLADVSSSQLISCIGTLIGKSIKNPSFGQPSSKITLSITNATRTEVTQRLLTLLEQEFGRTIEAQPDGSFIARQVAQPRP